MQKEAKRNGQEICIHDVNSKKMTLLSAMFLVGKSKALSKDVQHMALLVYTSASLSLWGVHVRLFYCALGHISNSSGVIKQLRINNVIQY